MCTLRKNKENEFLAKVTLSRTEDNEKVQVTIRRLSEKEAAGYEKAKPPRANFSIPVIGLN